MITILTFLIFLSIFLFIGLLSVFQKQKTKQDYLLAGQKVKPWLVSLSAVATNNSGYMFIGMIGFTYNIGLSSIWLMIGWIFGDFLASIYIHKEIRIQTEKNNALSYSELVSNWHKNNFKKLRLFIAIIIVIFLGTYAAAQLSAGSKALHVIFGWNYSIGAIVGASIVLIYCYAGGIRASIWTDAAQAIVMLFSMVLLFLVCFLEIGGLNNFKIQVQNISDSYMNLFPENLLFGSPLFVLGWIFAGFAVISQPHIMVRFMTLDNPANISKVRGYYYSFYLLFFILTILVGICARVLIYDTNSFDAELALPILAQTYLNPVMVGLILAGIFAASMSTADSLLLSCSAAITNDLNFKKKPTYFQTKLVTAFVTIVALLISLFGNESVFDLVLISWSALGAAFGPLLVLYVIGEKPTEGQRFVVIFVGLVTMIVWRNMELTNSIYEVAPGMIAGFLIFYPLKLIKNLNF